MMHEDQTVTGGLCVALPLFTLTRLSVTGLNQSAASYVVLSSVTVFNNRFIDLLISVLFISYYCMYY